MTDQIKKKDSTRLIHLIWLSNFPLIQPVLARSRSFSFIPAKFQFCLSTARDIKNFPSRFLQDRQDFQPFLGRSTRFLVVSCRIDQVSSRFLQDRQDFQHFLQYRQVFQPFLARLTSFLAVSWKIDKISSCFLQDRQDFQPFLAKLTRFSFISFIKVVYFFY